MMTSLISFHCFQNWALVVENAGNAGIILLFRSAAGIEIIGVLLSSAVDVVSVASLGHPCFWKFVRIMW